MADVAAGEFGDVVEGLCRDGPVLGDQFSDVFGCRCRDVVDDEPGLKAIDELVGAAVGGAYNGRGCRKVVQKGEEPDLCGGAHLVHFFNLGDAVARDETGLAVAVGQCLGNFDVDVGAVEFVNGPLGGLKHGVDEPFGYRTLADAGAPKEHDLDGGVAVVLAGFNLALQVFGNLAGLSDEVGGLVGGVLGGEHG